MEILAKINLIDVRLIEFKLMGLSYKEMEFKLRDEFGVRSYSWTTIRDLFSSNGRLNEVYQSNINRYLDNLKVDAMNLLKSQVKNAVRAVIYLMNNSKSESMQLRSAKYIIDRNFGPISKAISTPENDLLDQLLLEINLIDKPL